MKLLITTDNFLPRWDGIARFLVEIIPRLSKRYTITVVAPDFGGAIKMEGVHVVRMPVSKKRVGDYPVPKYSYKKIKDEVKRADIVFNQTIGPIGAAAIRAARRCNKPLVSFTHSLEWELVPRSFGTGLFRKLAYPLTRFYVRYMLRRCTALIVPSQNTAEELSWQGIMTVKRIAHLGVDVNKFKHGSRAQARKKLGLPLDAFIIGAHGRIAYEKNLVTLLRAFLRLKIPKKRLLLVADGVPELKKRLTRPNVIMPGVQEDVVPWLRAMDLYIQSSYTETTSLAVLEAMACRLPVISSRVGFIQHYIHEGENGFFFDKRNEFDLFRKIEFVMRIPQKELSAIAKRARETVEQDFNWDKSAREIIKVLKEFGPEPEKK